MDALLVAAQGGASTHPILSKIQVANIINRLHGGPAIGAWEIDQLPDDWIDAMVLTGTKLQALQRGLQKLETYKQAWRANHPTYRKHIH